MSSVRRGTRHAGRLGWALAASLLAACTAETREPEPTQIVLVVDSDSVATRIDITVEGPTVTQTASATLVGDDAPTLPITLSLRPAEGAEDAEFRVVARAQLDPVVTGFGLLEAKATTRFIPGRSLELELFLPNSCLFMPCTPPLSCGRGGCRSEEIPPESLPPWEGPESL